MAFRINVQKSDFILVSWISGTMVKINVDETILCVCHCHDQYYSMGVLTQTHPNYKYEVLLYAGIFSISSYILVTYAN